MINFNDFKKKCLYLHNKIILNLYDLQIIINTGNYGCYGYYNCLYFEFDVDKDIASKIKKNDSDWNFNIGFSCNCTLPLRTRWLLLAN
jgi:hypothetical protein